MSLDVKTLRADFPALDQKVHGDKPLIYLDSAATALKPRCVIEAVNQYYRQETGNVHRGLHALSSQATDRYEATRERVRDFINAPDRTNVVFTSGTTAAINIVAQGYLRSRLQPGDEILITHMEHHSNLVPWQMLCEQTGAELKVAPISDDGELILSRFESLVSPRTRFISMVLVSNSLGTINPVRQIIRLAHQHNIPVLLDAAQAVATLPIDVQALDCDFLAFSGHKVFGPTGVGVLYGKTASLEQVEPVLGGGDMILNVTLEKSTYQDLPYRLEAGTPPIASVIGLGAALEYVRDIGMESIAAHDLDLTRYAHARLAEIEGLRFIGLARQKTAIISFVLDAAHPHDVGTILDSHGIAVRAGHHCTQPVMQRYGIPATTRVSLSLYNTEQDIDQLVAAVQQVKEVFV